MTTNLSKEAIQKYLDEATQKDPYIKITIKISQAIEYLDVKLENVNGHLTTCIYHKSASEPYILPYDSDYPRHIHSNIIYTALIRAARICSTIEMFDKERLSLEMILLFNGYPPRFINYNFKYFFEKFNAMKVWNDLHSPTYQKLHQTLLYTLTRRENQLQLEPTSIFMDEYEQNEYENNKIYLHYTFETGPLLNFKNQFRHIWRQFYVYPGSRFRNTRLILGIKLNRTLQSLLIKKKPPRHLLTKIEPSSNQQLKQ